MHICRNVFLEHFFNNQDPNRRKYTFDSLVKRICQNIHRIHRNRHSSRFQISENSKK